MLCLACGVCVQNSKLPDKDVRLSAMLCPVCDHSLRPAPARRLASGLPVRASYAHEGAAQRLVHRLKYDGVAGLAARLAGAMAPLVPSDVAALVPIPRVLARRARYGVDQSVVMARALGRITGLPMVRLLGAPLWSAAHAGHSRQGRPPGAFRRRAGHVDGGVLLVDDVVTTGTTLESATAATGGEVIGGLAFTMALGGMVEG